MHVRLLLAIAIVGLLSACRQPSADEHVKRATAYADQSRLAEAIIEYRHALQLEPRRADIRAKLADAYTAIRDVGNARKEYVRVADLLPDDPAAQLRAGNTLLQAGSFADAKSRATRVLALDRRNVAAQILLGNALAGLKDLDGAISEYETAIALNPAQDSAYINIGTIQLVRGKGVEAEASFRKAIEVAPKSVSARMALANFLWATSRTADAESVLKDALALDPTNLEASRALGVFYLASNRAADAEPYYMIIADTANTTLSRIGLADYYVIARRLDDARKILTELAQKPDGYAMAVTRLAAIDAMQGDRAGALTRLHDVLTRFPKDASARLLNARVLLANGRREDALAEANTLVREEPNAPEAADAYLLVGQIQAAVDRPDEAVKAFEEVLKRQSRPLAADLALASLYLGQGSIAKATSYAQQARALDHRNPYARALLVRILISKGELAKAKDELVSLQNEFPNAAVVLDLVGAQQLADRQIDAARASYTKAAVLAPDDLEALAGLVTTDLAAGRSSSAVERIEAMLKRAPPSANLFMLSARTYTATGDLAKAETMLRNAIETDPARLQAYQLLGALYVTQHRLDEARQQFQIIANRNPRSTPANTMLGMLLEAQRRLPEAERQYQQTLAVDPQAAVAANNLAWIYVSGNRNLDRALELAQTARQQLPDEPHVNDTLGWIYYRRNLASLALPYLEASVRKDPDDPVTHYHLGMAYVEVGEWAKAKKELQRALTSNTAFDGKASAREALARIGS